MAEQSSSIEARLARLEAQIARLPEHMDERPLVYNAQLFDLGDPRYMLRYPLLATIEVYPDEVIASIPDLDLYASGLSDSMALANLASEIVATYERLLELSPDQLGPLPRSWLATLNKVVERVNA